MCNWTILLLSSKHVYLETEDISKFRLLPLDMHKLLFSGRGLWRINYPNGIKTENRNVRQVLCRILFCWFNSSWIDSFGRSTLSLPKSNLFPTVYLDTSVKNTSFQLSTEKSEKNSMVIFMDSSYSQKCIKQIFCFSLEIVHIVLL